MTTRKPIPWDKERWLAALNAAWEDHDLGSRDDASRRVPPSLKRCTLARMKVGDYQPSVASVLAWAEGIGENANRWLELAGYPPIPADAIIPDETVSQMIERFIAERPDEATPEAVEKLRQILTEEIARIGSTTK